MILTYHGLQFFRVQFGDTVLAFNPTSAEQKSKSVTKPNNFGSDIALVSLNHPDCNGIEVVSRGDKTPFVVEGPGEYEIGGVHIRGFQSETTYDGKKYFNTLYTAVLEDITLFHPGALANADLDEKTLEEIDGVDIAFLPVGGAGLLDAKRAHALAVQIEPGIIIPAPYDDAPLAAFLKEEGGAAAAPLDKLTIKKSGLAGKEGEVVVLKSV